MLRTMIGRVTRWFTVVGTGLVLASCGGGGDSCTNVFGNSCVATGTSTQVASLTLLIDPSQTVATMGNETVVATVIAKNAANQALPGVAVVLQVNGDADIVANAALTDEQGELTGTVRVGSDRTPRTVTVTATANDGKLVVTKTFQVVSATPEVTSLTLQLNPAQSINNSGSEFVTATAVAKNADNQAISGVPVVLRVDGGADLIAGATTTNALGELTATIRIGDDRSNRVVTVTALANDGKLSVKKTFQIVGAKLSGTAIPAVLTPATSGVVKYKLKDATDNPMVGAPIVVTGAGGVQSSGVTDANGDFDYTYVAPSATGELLVRASAGGVEINTTVLVQSSTSGGIPVVSSADQPIRSVSVSANPTVVPVNVGTTNNQAQVRVLFLTDSNAPVKNMRVRFDLANDPNSIGGTFTTGTNVVYSDVNGVATTAYVPATRSSPTDGVLVRACWDYADFAACDPAKSVTATLTVIADPVSITVGTNALIENGASDLTYVKRYVVQVVDSSGLAKPDVQITPSIDLLRYIKGQYQAGLETWAKVAPITNCDNEDLNRNNTNEVYADGWVEDANRSFNLTAGRPALEPRKADVAISFENGVSRTDSSGIVVLRIEYPQDLGSWVEFNLQVSASGVSASEGRANYNSVLPVPAAALNDIKVAPAFVTSPYGVLASPIVSKTFGGKTYLLCTEPN